MRCPQVRERVTIRRGKGLECNLKGSNFFFPIEQTCFRLAPLEWHIFTPPWGKWKWVRSNIVGVGNRISRRQYASIYEGAKIAGIMGCMLQAECRIRETTLYCRLAGYTVVGGPTDLIEASEFNDSALQAAFNATNMSVTVLISIWSSRFSTSSRGIWLPDTKIA